jgi:hypothetical protein
VTHQKRLNIGRCYEKYEKGEEKRRIFVRKKKKEKIKRKLESKGQN